DHRSDAARRLADRPVREQRARAGAVAVTVAHAARDAVVGAFVARVGADRRVRARADAARLVARLAEARAVRSAADAVEAEAALAVVRAGAGGADLRAGRDRSARAAD